MKCPICNSETVRTHETYHFTESGLDYVYLEGVDLFKCSCGEVIVSIPAMPQLHSIIAFDVIRKKSLLIGQEIRFLRKNMGLTATKLSKIIGVDNATVSRWENGKQLITKPHDHFIRLVYSNIKGIPKGKIKHLIKKDFEEIEPEQKKILKKIIPWPQSNNKCTTPA
jgi:putative zinc finger/helix-turn-helix YgiT family protein